MINAEIERLAIAFQWRRVARFRSGAREFLIFIQTEIVAALVAENVRRRRRRSRRLQKCHIRAIGHHQRRLVGFGVLVAAA